MSSQKNYSTTQSPENKVEFRPSIILRIFFFFGTIFSASLLFIEEGDFYFDFIFGGLAIFSAFIFIFFGFRFQFDKNFIYYKNGLGKKTQVAWNEIDNIRGETFIHNLRIYDSIGRKLITIPYNSHAYGFFTNYIGTIKTEFFNFKKPVTFKRRIFAEVILSSVAILNGIIAMASYQKSPNLFAIFLGLISIGGLFGIWLTPIHKIHITKDILILSTRGNKNYEIEPNSIRRISLQFEGVFFQVSISSSNHKEINLLHFDVGSSILYNTLMAWWRERREYD